jgi:hypothetical protein
MNLELDFQVRQEHIKDLMKEAEEHRLFSKARREKKQAKLQAKSEERSKRLEKPKTYREALESAS